MNIFSWWDIPASVLLVGLSVWLSRLLLETRLKIAVQHEFDAKLHELKAHTEKHLETLRATLRSREADIVALRAGALDALSKRHGVIMDRRIAAIDEIWAALHDRKQLSFVASMLGSLNLAELEKTYKTPEARQTFKAMLPKGMDALTDRAQAWRSQPYISPMAWAYFRAYDSLVTSAYLYAYAFSTDLSLGVIDKDNVVRMTVSALPHWQSEIDKFGWGASFRSLDELEAKLLSEVIQMMEGVDLDEAQLRKAQAIVSAAASSQKEAGSYVGGHGQILSSGPSNA